MTTFFDVCTVWSGLALIIISWKYGARRKNWEVDRRFWSIVGIIVGALTMVGVFWRR